MEKSIQIKGFEKSEYPELHAALVKNMAAYNMNKSRVFVSTRMKSVVSFWLFGDFIIISDKVLKKMNEKEIESIIAHEFSHLYNRDSVLALTVYIIFILAYFLVSLLLFYFYIKVSNNITSFLVIPFVLFFPFIYFYIKTIFKIGIKQEYRSDIEAVLKTKNPDAMINALLKIHYDLFTVSNRPNYFAVMFKSISYLLIILFGESHPSLKDRIAYIKLLNEAHFFEKY